VRRHLHARPRSPSGEYQVPTTDFLQKVLDAVQQGENPLFFSSLAWELGHDLIDKQEYALAAECFRRLLGSAASAADRFLIEAARVAGQLCSELSRGRLVGKEVQEARETLRKDLTFLSNEEVDAAAAALAAHAGGQALNPGHVPSVPLAGQTVGANVPGTSPLVEAQIAGRRRASADRQEIPSCGAIFTLPHLEVRVFGRFEVLCRGRLCPLATTAKC
jgi:hypothetical protein